MQRVVFLALISLLLTTAGLQVPAGAALPAGTIIQLYADSRYPDGSLAGDPATLNLTVGSTTEPISEPKIVSVSPRDSLTDVKLDENIVITFDRAMDKTSTQSALQFDPVLDTPVYSWSTDGTVLTITHKPLQAAVVCSAAVMSTAKDTAGAALGEYHWTFNTIGGARFDPAQMYVKPNVYLTTPHILYNDPSNPTQVTIFVTLPDDAVINTASYNGSLTCVQKGSAASSIASTWNAANHEIAITANIATPGPSVEVVKSITFIQPSGPRDKQVFLNGLPALTLHIASSIPGDFNWDAVFNSNDMPLFNSEWIRWHASPVPAYTPSIDWIYDIYPHTSGVWQNWIYKGDGKINIDDATAFTECYVASRLTNRPSNSLYGNYTKMTYSGYKMYVRITRAPYGMYRSNVILPYRVRFNPAIAANGSLVNVVRQAGSGSMLFSEYDAAKRTVRITGTVTGYAPYLVAVINFY